MTECSGQLPHCSSNPAFEANAFDEGTKAIREATALSLFSFSHTFCVNEDESLLLYIYQNSANSAESTFRDWLGLVNEFPSTFGEPCDGSP